MNERNLQIIKRLLDGRQVELTAGELNSICSWSHYTRRYGRGTILMLTRNGDFVKINAFNPIRGVWNDPDEVLGFRQSSPLARGVLLIAG